MNENIRTLQDFVIALSLGFGIRGLIECMKGHSFGLVSTKNETRVSNAEAKRSDNNQAKAIVNPSKLYRGKQIWYLHSLKTNKEALICDQIRVNVALAQLVTTVYATREDEKNRGTQEAQKDAHSCSQR